jgi:hypothetical protein
MPTQIRCSCGIHAKHAPHPGHSPAASKPGSYVYASPRLRFNIRFCDESARLTARSHRTGASACRCRAVASRLQPRIFGRASLLYLAACNGGGAGAGMEAGSQFWGANVFRLAQMASDCLGALVQVGGSPFDCAGLGSTDWMRMACKRPGVRVPLAPHSDVSAGQRSVDGLTLCCCYA